MTEIEKETGMTDAECEYWDEYITNTKNPVQLGPNLVKLGIKPGFAHNYLPLNELDNDVIEYLRKQSTTYHKSNIQIINDLVHEKLAVGA
jgi:dTDP-4-dehydrorhamnose 3,5-epimerase-like enzyme